MILPREYLTGETFKSIFASDLSDLVRRWQGRAFENRDEVMAALRQESCRIFRSLATLAGWELAVLDLAGKIFGFAAGEMIAGMSVTSGQLPP